jgi:hypothetical protein
MNAPTKRDYSWIEVRKHKKTLIQKKFKIVKI